MMSETDGVKVTSTVATNLNDLGQFRIKNNVVNAKPAATTTAAVVTSTPKATAKFKAALTAAPSQKIERVPGKKRIQVMADSDSDGADISNPTKKTKIEFSVKEKEERFLALATVASEYDTMDIQDSLVRCDWVVEDALKYLKEKCVPKCQPSKATASKVNMKANANGGGRVQNAIKKPTYASDEDSVDKEYGANHVYDSEDSDNEAAYVMTTQRKKVLDFLNTATALELQTVKNLSEKKANLITELRPFDNWLDLCQKLDSSKSLSTELLNYTQELLNKQNNVANILAKCNKLVQRLESAIEAGAGITEQPKILNKKLKLADYQLIGLNWLTVMHKQQMNGILADEMGLGKTIQVIAFLAYLKENNLAKSAHMIVVPSSTLDNWAAEFTRWCPHLKVERYHGTQEERKRMRIRYAREGFSKFDVLITTYHIVSSTPEEKKMFRICKLHYVVFDEAHLLKNMTTQRYANLVTINAEMRILLTGTPLQNNLLELMSLLCFVMPSIFGKNMEDIKSLFAKKNKTDGKEDVSQFQETQIERAKRIMKPFVLRRLKKDVLNNLPKKFTYVEKIPMTANQKRYYNDLVEYYSNNKDEVCNSDRVGITIMAEMRKLANHPLLGRYYFTDNKINELAKRLAKVPAFKKSNSEYIFEDLAVMSDFKIWQLCHKYELDDVKIPDELICDSGKFKQLDVMLPRLKDEGHRVLIFSQFTVVLDIVEEYLRIRNYCYHRLDGTTAVEDRLDMINDFNSDADIFIFLLSTRAGGVGINLTAADTCIIHDIDFNPYNDKQAEDRCHRMGQTRPVSIYRLISEGTIEEGMLLVAEEKLKLEQDITSNEKGEVQQAKCVVRLLAMALGLDKDEEELLNKSINDSLTSQNNL